MNLSKSFLKLPLCLGLLLGMQSCSEEDLAAVVGLVAIGVGAAIVADATDAHCVGGYNYVCREYRDYWGIWRRDCGYRWDSCHHIGFGKKDHNDLHLSKTEDFESLKNVELHAADWAREFSMGLENSGRLISAFTQARDGNTQELKALGFDADDIAQLAALKLPVADSIDRVARELDIQPSTFKAALGRLVERASQEKSKGCRKIRRGPRGSMSCAGNAALAEI